MTDGGPQFSSHKFAKFCERWGVRHQMSSPHYPQSNGHADASVKAMKSLIAKTTMNGDLDMDAFRQDLLDWRNTPDASGRSPAQKLYGQPFAVICIRTQQQLCPRVATASRHRRLPRRVSFCRHRAQFQRVFTVAEEAADRHFGGRSGCAARRDGRSVV